MNYVGIESINAYVGTSCVKVSELAHYRGLNMARFDNLLMNEKSFAMPYEDPVTYGANAAMPLIQNMSQEEKDKIELIITCTESGFDFGKSMSTYFHKILGIKNNCRLLEIKSACYSGVAGLQMACNFILSQSSPGAKALVIATDISRSGTAEASEQITFDKAFFEPSSGAGAVAFLVSETPYVFQLDQKASGYYGYEVMDTCRPAPEIETGDSDLSLLSYLDCCEKTFLAYQERVKGAHYVKTFDYLSFHTPFGGMVKGAHRNIMHKHVKATPDEINQDFERRVAPGLEYCSRVGNIMGATALFSLLSTIDNGNYESARRIGIFSYGSGCCSEFFSGVVNREGRGIVNQYQLKAHLDSRSQLSISTYDELVELGEAIKFGTRNAIVDPESYSHLKNSVARETLVLKQIKEYERIYEWVS